MEQEVKVYEAFKEYHQNILLRDFKRKEGNDNGIP